MKSENAFTIKITQRLIVCFFPLNSMSVIQTYWHFFHVVEREEKLSRDNNVKREKECCREQNDQIEKLPGVVEKENDFCQER